MRRPSRVTLLALGLGMLLACGKTVATVKLSKVGATEQTTLSAAEGTSLGFAVHADSYSYSGQNYVIVDAELLRGGAVVQKMSCQGFEFEGGAGSGCGATHYSSSCSTVVPAGGIDAVRVTTHLENGNEVELEGLEVRVLQK